MDIEYVKEGQNWFLRLYIDKDDGVDIEECGIVSERLSEKLDEIDPIPHNYYLEVSSPGAERPLKKPSDFTKAIGKNVHVKTFQAQVLIQLINFFLSEMHLNLFHKFR